MILAGLSLAALLALTACGDSEDTWTQIESSGVLRVGVDPTFPPFAVAEGVEVGGLDIDLARALAEEMGLEAEFTYFGYDGLYDALTTRQVDVLISALVIVPDRMQDIAYSASYYDAGQVLITPAGSILDDMTDLDERALAVELGALGHVEALEWQRRLPAMVIETYGSVGEALQATSEGSAQAALVDSVGARLYLRDHPDLALSRLPESVTSEPYAVALRIGDRTLLEKVNTALDVLTARGELGTIIERWLGP